MAVPTQTAFLLSESPGPNREPGLEQPRSETRTASLVRSAPWLVVLAIAALAADSFADPDLWRHLIVGRIVLHTRHLPLRDTFSYTAFGMPWRQHEWLAETIMAAFYDCLGVFGLRMMKLLCAGAIVILLAIGMSETGAHPRIQRTMLIVAAPALATQMQFRPQLFTFVMLAMILALMAAHTYRDSRRLWMAIPVFALWANMHGGFVVGLAVMATYAAAVSCGDVWQGRGVSRGLRPGAITIGCALATLVNPFGIGVWFNAMHSITDRFVKAAIVEWRPLLSVLAEALRNGSPAAVIYLIPIGFFAALAVAVVMAPAVDDAAILAVAALLAFSAFYAVRNMALGVIAVVIPLTRHAGPAALRHNSRARRELEDESAFSPLLAGCLAIVLAYAGGLFSNQLRPGIECPVGAIAFMNEHHMDGNILCDFRWGGYVMWHMPKSKVFIDSRWELVYPHDVMREFVRFEQDKPGAQRVLDGYPHDFVIEPPGSRAYGVVTRDPDWTIIYRDPIAVLFARANSELARANPVPVIGAKPPQFFP